MQIFKIALNLHRYHTKCKFKTRLVFIYLQKHKLRAIFLNIYEFYSTIKINERLHVVDNPTQQLLSLYKKKSCSLNLIYKIGMLY